MRVRWIKFSIVILALLLCFPLFAADSDEASASLKAQVADDTAADDQTPTKLLLGGTEIRLPRDPEQTWWPYAEKISDSRLTTPRVEEMAETQISVNGVVVLDIRNEKNDLAKAPKELLINEGEQLTWGQGYYLVKIEGDRRTQDQIDQLTQAGAVLGEYLPVNTYIAAIPSDRVGEVRNLPFVTYCGDYQPLYKINPGIGTIPVPAEILPEATWRFEVSLHDGADVEEVLAALSSRGIFVEESDIHVDEYNNFIRFYMDPKGIVEIAKIPGIKWISEFAYPRLLASSSSPATIPMVLQNNGTFTTSTATGWKLWNAGIDGNASGSAQIISMMDTGLDTKMEHFAEFSSGNAPAPSATHRKVRGYYNAGGDTCNEITYSGGHGTWTSQHAAGSISNMTAPIDTTHTPNTYYDNGIARDAKIYFQDIGTSTGGLNITSMSGSITNAIGVGSYIQNNSWGTSTADYSADSSAIDSTLFSNPNMVVTFSVGNDGTQGAGSIGSPSTAKNCITVGGVGVSSPTRLFMDCSWDGTTTCGGTNDLGSSTGPVLTSLRVKPDICGYMATAASVGGENMAGENPVAMCQADATRTIYWDWNQTSYYGGTSFAAPQVAGLAALVRDYFMAGYYPTGTATPANAFTPTGALVKAVILASGENLDTTSYPTTSFSVARRYSNDQGYGRANLPAVLKIGASAPYLWAHDDTVTDGGTDTFTYTIGSNSLPIRIMMVYYDAAGNNLVENVNLEADINGGSIYRGNVFTTGGWSTTGGTADATNNTEGIFLPTTAFSAGQTLTVRVLGVNAPGGQNYAIVVSGDLAEQGQGPTATMDKGRYVCGDTVYATISDTTGTPTNAVYHSDSGDPLPATISGSGPNYTVAGVTTTQLGAADGDEIWITFTGGDAGSYSSAHSTLDCSPTIVISSVDKIKGGCDGDEFIDTNETVIVNVWLQNNETYQLNMPFYADLVVDPAHPNPDVTIVNGTALYGALQPGVPGRATEPFQVRYTGAGTGPVQVYFKVQNIRSIDGTWTYNAAATPLTFTRYADANWQAGTALVTESFDLTTFPPTNWVRTSLSGTGTWARSTILFGSPLTLTPHSGAGLAEFNQTLSATSSARLASPVFSLAGYTGGMTTFYFSQTAYTVGGASAFLTVEISTDGGTTYTPLQTFDQLNASAGTGAWLYCAVDLSDYAGMSNLRVGFRGDAETGMTHAIDDVWIGSATRVNDTQTCAGAPVLTVTNYNWDFVDSQCNDFQGDPTQWDNSEAGWSIDAGESGTLTFYISNNGNEPAYGVQATLSCPSCPAGVTICKDTADYGNIPYGTGYAYGPGTDGFQIAVGTSVSPGQSLPFVLTVTTTNTPAYNPTINIIQDRIFSIRTGTPTNNVNASSTWEATMEEHFTTALTTAGAGGRVGFTTAWTQKGAAISNADDSDGDGYSCRITVQRNTTNYARHAWSTASPILVNHDINYFWEVRLGGDTDGLFSFDYTLDGGTTWGNLAGPWNNEANTTWYYMTDSIWFAIYGDTGSMATANQMYNNPNFALRFLCTNNGSAGNTATYDYVDNFILAYYNYQNLATSCTGVCLGPEAPTLLSIIDESACSQDGIRIYYDGSWGATRYDLVRDSSVVVIGYTTGALYNPGDSLSHNYVIRAVNGSGNADSGATSFSDQAQSVIPTITCSGTCTTGDTLTTEAGMTNYQWYRGGGPIGGANSYTYVANVAGTYTVSYDAGACPSNLSAGTVVSGASCTMTVDVTPNGTTTVCGGQDIVFTATPTGGTAPYTYQWTENGSNVGGNSNTYTANKASGSYTYNCKVTDSGACVDITDGTASTGTWTAIPATPTATNNGPICAGSTLNLYTDTVSGATYSWTGPNGFTSSLEDPSIASATTAATGLYSVTVTVSGCTSAAGTTNATVNALPTPSISGANANTCPAEYVDLTATAGMATYQWYLDGSPVGTGLSTYQATASGSYTVFVTDANGCGGTSAPHVVTITSCGCTAPTQEVIETVNGKIGFNWVDTDAAYYRVVRGLQANLAALITTGTDFACTAAFGDINAVDIQLDDPQAETGRCYYYLIQGYNGTDPDLCVGPAGDARVLGVATPRSIELTNTCN